MHEKNRSVLTIDTIRQRSKKFFDDSRFVQKVYLFGSYARQEANPNSDIDFLVETNRDVGLEFFGLYDYLQEEFGKTVDVLTQEEAERIMKKNVERDKVLIYERAN